MNGIPKLIPVHPKTLLSSVNEIKVGDVLVGEMYFSGYPSTRTAHSIQINEIENGRYKGFHVSNGQTSWKVELVYNSKDDNFDIFVVKSNGELRSLGIFSIITKEHSLKGGSNISRRIDPNHQETDYQVELTDKDRGHFVHSDISNIPGVGELVDTMALRVGTIVHHGGDSVPPSSEHIDTSLLVQAQSRYTLKGISKSIDGNTTNMSCSIQRVTQAGIIVAGSIVSKKTRLNPKKEYLLTNFSNIGYGGFDCDVLINGTHDTIGIFHFDFGLDSLSSRAIQKLRDILKGVKLRG